MRLALGFTVLSIPLFGLDTLFSSLVDDNSILGFLFRWLRYSIVTFFGIIVVLFYLSNLGSQINQNKINGLNILDKFINDILLLIKFDL